MSASGEVKNPTLIELFENLYGMSQRSQQGTRKKKLVIQNAKILKIKKDIFIKHVSGRSNKQLVEYAQNKIRFNQERCQYLSDMQAQKILGLKPEATREDSEQNLQPSKSPKTLKAARASDGKPKAQPSTKETADTTVKQVMRMPKQFNPESPKQTFTKLAALQKPKEFKGVVESQYTRHQREAKEMQHNQMIASGIKKLNIPQPKSKVVVTNKNHLEISKSQKLNYEISNQNTEKYLHRINKL